MENNLVNILKSYIRKGTNLLELGCGNGQLIKDIVQKHPDLGRVACVDYFNSPTELPKKVSFFKQDLENFEMDGVYDLVIINHVLEHIKNPIGLLEKIKKNLSNFGKILIVVPNRKGFLNEADVYFPEHGKHYFLWDKQSLGFSLNRIGFTCRFHNLYFAGSNNFLLKYMPAIFRIQNPNLICVAMVDSDPKI
ncbi:MAG: Methyltransferase type 12 [Parcubacteria group bacterium GW2011_GWD2_40_9]|nr:MAG: Methyltransferase type 12 [Parcubacteria group bacterium GW2011_GWD2_40_9]